MLEFGLFVLAVVSLYLTSALVDHYGQRTLLARERRLAAIPIMVEVLPPTLEPPPRTRLVMGSAVISMAWLRRLVVALRALCGSQVSAYERMADRGRREAIVRMKRQAASLNATVIFNVRLEISRIAGHRYRGVGAVEVLAYGTALIPMTQQQSAPQRRSRPGISKPIRVHPGSPALNP